jgi:hypothetical protein
VTTSKQMWMGTAEHMVLVPCPDTGLTMGAEGWQTSGTYLNGGAYLRGSQTTHRTYQATWSMISREDAAKIEDIYRGAYGDGPVYMQEAFTVGNLLPYYVSVPRLQAKDAPTLLPEGRRPTLIDTFNNTQDFPSRSAVFQLTGNRAVDMPKVYIPNPSKGSVVFGVYGTTPTGTASVRIRPVGSDSTGMALPVLPTDTPMGPGMSGLGGDSGYELFLYGEGTITIAGIVAISAPTGIDEAYYGKSFISGRGTSGMRFNGGLNITGYSAPSAKDFVSVSASLLEVGAWEQ